MTLATYRSSDPARALGPGRILRRLGAGLALIVMLGDAAAASRSSAGLVALYDFRSDDGVIVHDRSEVGEPIDLEIANPEAVRRSEGALEIVADTIVRSKAPPRRLVEAIRRTGELTIEAWLHPAAPDLTGPARIVTVSRNGSLRNATLGQDGGRFDVRLRTTKTTENGIPSLPSPDDSLATKLTHVVFTRSRGGMARLFLDGEQVAERRDPASLSGWDDSFELALGNELSGDRPWRGTYRLVALYRRALRPAEVARHFEAGPDAASADGDASGDVAAARLFDEEIAPLLARHCLECHDTANRKGKLDLSRRESALAGGRDGPAIVPGDPEESLAWHSVESDEMPEDRPPLSADEKKLLREWIEAGAPWTVETVDPLAHEQDRRAARNWARRLTVPEYIETVRSAVGVDITEEARDLLPPDVRADGFSNTAYNLNVDLGHVEAWARLASMIVERMDVDAFATRFAKARRFTDDAMGDLIARMGRWLLRGPLEEHEIIAYRGISTSVASAGGTFEEAVALLVEAMLQSPRFVYRIEGQLGDGTRWPVGEFELASRMSYFLWGGPPDEELLRAAELGELADPDVVAAEVARMLEDPRAITRSLTFADEWLHLTRLDHLQPDGSRFPDWDPSLAADMRAETRAFFREIVWDQGRPLRDLFKAQVTFVTPRLASHYGLDAWLDGPGGGTGAPNTPVRLDVSSIPSRGGLLTQGSILTIGGDDASMVTRGLFILHDVLRSGVKDPPPGTDTTPVPAEPGLSRRQIAEKRVADRSCGGCHSKFEPLAFGLERFDGLGAYEEIDEHGNRLREDGEILFPGEADPVPYRTIGELMDLLAASDRVGETITWKLTQFALGRPLVAADRPILEEIHRVAGENGGTYPAVATAIVMSDLMQTTPTEAPEAE